VQRWLERAGRNSVDSDVDGSHDARRQSESRHSTRFLGDCQSRRQLLGYATDTICIAVRDHTRYNAADGSDNACRCDSAVDSDDHHHNRTGEPRGVDLRQCFGNPIQHFGNPDSRARPCRQITNPTFKFAITDPSSPPKDLIYDASGARRLAVRSGKRASGEVRSMNPNLIEMAATRAILIAMNACRV
jgi:hypothetical protein